MWVLSILIMWVGAGSSSPDPSSLPPWATFVAGLGLPLIFCYMLWNALLKARQEATDAQLTAHKEALDTQRWINEQVIPLLTRVSDAFSIILPLVQQRAPSDETQKLLREVLKKIDSQGS